jgi:hypothetical protein
MNRTEQVPLQHAGWCLLEAVRLEAKVACSPESNGLDTVKYHALLASARRYLAKAAPEENHLLFTATKTALETAEARERGDDLLGGVVLFKNLVENLHGGARDLYFGGIPRQGPKPTADQAYYRAAAVALWVRLPESRNQLVAEARIIVGIGSLSKLRKLVENFHQRHDVDLERSRSPLSVHMPLVTELITHHGYRTLRDF